MKKLNIRLYPLLFACISLMTFSCSDNDPAMIEDEESGFVDNTQTEDLVEEHFSGKVAMLLANNDHEVLNYLNRRLSNVSTNLSGDAAVILMDETTAGNTLDNDELYNKVKDSWMNNDVLLFLSPWTNTCKLINKLKCESTGELIDDPTTDDMDKFQDIGIFGIRGDGHTLYLSNFSSKSGCYKSTTYDVNESGEMTLESIKENDDVQNSVSIPNEYNKGRVAEMAAEWLNEFADNDAQPNRAFTRTDGQYAMKKTSVTYNKKFFLEHRWIEKYAPKKAKIPNGSHYDMKVRISATGSYAEAEDCDIYDIIITEEFPGNETCIRDKYVYEKAAYNYKYTGGCYYGPMVDLHIFDSHHKTLIDSNWVDVLNPVPRPEIGQSTQTHNPMQIGFGGGLTGNLSEQSGLSLGLSMNVQLPSTSVSYSHSEMPADYSDKNARAIWVFNTNYRVYSGTWGSNKKFHEFPEIVQKKCITTQAVTFKLNESKERYSTHSTKISLVYSLGWRVYNEYSDPWKIKVNIQEFGEFVGGYGYDYDKHFRPGGKDFYMELPTVSRYFEKYTPYPFKIKGEESISEWTYVENLLKGNVNYRALKDETLRVGAQTSKGVEETALKIWRETLNALVKQYDGQVNAIKNEYVIGLARTDGSHVKLGLNIKGSNWQIIENVDDIK